MSARTWRKENPWARLMRINWHNLYGKQLRGVLKLEKQMPCDPAIPLLSIFVCVKKTEKLI